MDTKARLIVGSIVAFMIIFVGIIMGLFWQWLGFTQVSLTSWHYWSVIALIFASIITHNLTKQKRLFADEALGAALNMYVVACAGFSVATLLSEASISIKPFLIGSAVFWIAFFGLRFIIDREPVKSLLQSFKK